MDEKLKGAEQSNNNDTELPTILQLDKTDEELFTRTKMNRQVFDFIHNLLESNLAEEDNSVSSEIQLFIALQLLASGECELQFGDNEISEAYISWCIENVIHGLIEIAPQFIKFPEEQELPVMKQQFQTIAENEHAKFSFPNIIGAIDCAHIQLEQPESHPDLYLNQHSQYSINVQLVCGPDLQIFNVCAAFPGSKDNAYIWQNSKLRLVLSDGNMTDSWLIGDSSYPQEPWLMTPVNNPETPEKELYNTAHKFIARKTIKQCIGILKTRFECLQTALKCSPDRVCAIVIACCVLHNICIQHNMKIEGKLEQIDQDCENNDVLSFAATEEGIAARIALISGSFAY